MERVVIIGNSGAARECYWLLQDMLAADARLRNRLSFGGFVAWRGYPPNLCELTSFQLGSEQEYQPREEDRLVIGIGDPALRAAVLRYYQECSCSFLNLVHPKAYVCPSAVMGVANIIQRDSTIYCNARIGNGNYLNGAVNIAHDAVIGDCNFLGPYSMVLGGASIGDGNHLGPRTLILEKQRAGSHNLCAPDSVLYKGCGDHCRMAGSPAIKIGTYPDSEFS